MRAPCRPLPAGCFGASPPANPHAGQFRFASDNETTAGCRWSSCRQSGVSLRFGLHQRPISALRRRRTSKLAWAWAFACSRYGDHHPGVIGKADSGPVACIANCSGGDCRNARAMVPQNMPRKAPPIRAAKTNIVMGLSSAGSCCARRQTNIAAAGRCRAVKRFTGTTATRCGGSVLVGDDGR